jgi:hypothetical protein
MKESKTITLDFPLTRGEQTITDISVRKPMSGELRGLALADLLQMRVDALVQVLPRITSPILTEADVRGLDPADLMQLGAEVAGFLLTRAAREPAFPTA